MDLDSIREALRKQPFRPFKLRLTDGREFDVPHPGFVAIAGNRTVIVTYPHPPAPDETYSIVEPLLIISLDYTNGQPDEAPKSKGNDQGDQ